MPLCLTFSRVAGYPKLGPRYFCSKLFTNRTKSLVSVSWPVTVNLVCGHSRAFLGTVTDRTEGRAGFDWLVIIFVFPLFVHPSTHPHTYTRACTWYVFMSHLYSNRLGKSLVLFLLFPLGSASGYVAVSGNLEVTAVCLPQGGYPGTPSGLSCSDRVWICVYTG